MPTAYINIGSNKGDRHALIEQAVALIESECGVRVRRAPLFYSEPWGFDSDAQFVNLGIAVEVTASPDELLLMLQKIERNISPAPHRDTDGNYIDRYIDIDIIAIDDLVINTPDLIVPHERMHLRDFVLVPLNHLAPGWKHPLYKATPSELMSRL